MASLFDTLPKDFFSPLSSPNRETYAACLLVFHDAFRDSPGGVERGSLVGKFAEYLERSGDSLVDEAETGEPAAEPELTQASGMQGYDSLRAEAGRILRKLAASGWMGEETLPDYTRLVTMPTRAKPFLDALKVTAEGGGTEYESHIVAIYSSLCGDSAREFGHHALLNANHHLELLVDSLKVLSQNIRTHYERLLEETREAGIPEILKLHYDQYLEQVVDRAYARLKTSDNLSRYRPKIQRSANAFKRDKAWVEKTATALAAIRREPVERAKESVLSSLEDILLQLRSLDPTLEEIDRRNMLYARSSLERIRARLRTDASVAGRLGVIIRKVAESPEAADRLRHHLYRALWLGKESRYTRTFRQETVHFESPQPAVRGAALERAEAEIRLRISRQLTVEKIAAWLDGRMGSRVIIGAGELATDAESFVKMVHAAVFAESRAARFPYSIRQGEKDIEAAGWIFRDHSYTRRT